MYRCQPSSLKWTLKIEFVIFHGQWVLTLCLGVVSSSLIVLLLWHLNKPVLWGKGIYFSQSYVHNTDTSMTD